MFYQLRTYTVNLGMMDQWVQHFNEKVIGVMEKAGITVEGAWVNEDKNQFIWIRSFPSAAEVEPREAAFYGSDEWKAIVDHTRSHLARISVKTMESVMKVPASR
jgi:hypothetical protein